MTMEWEPILEDVYLEALAVDDDGLWIGDVTQGGVRRISLAGEELGHWMPERMMIGGMLVNDDGALLLAGQDGIAWCNPDTGATGVLLTEIDGEPVRGVNEMTPDGEGGMIFGTIDLVSIMEGQRPGPSALYRLSADGRTTLLRDGLRFSNGLALGKDGARLYHNETFVGRFAYDVTEAGLSNRVAMPGEWDCDGMAMDVEGRVWSTGCTTPELIVLNDDGSVHLRVALPGEGSTNLRFGGADGRDLYVTTVTNEAVEGLRTGQWPTEKRSTLWRTRAPVAGRPVERTAFQLT